MGEPRMANLNWKSPDEWTEWSVWLAAGLHARNRWRLPVLMMGILFANGRRTVTSWLRAAEITDDFDDYYYFLAALGRKTQSVATRLLTLVLQTLPLPHPLSRGVSSWPRRVSSLTTSSGTSWSKTSRPGR